ncbi:MAG: OsmC family protein, partial [Bdellovibrio sp.]
LHDDRRMETQVLRSLQQPLKKHYLEEPQASLVTFHVTGKLEDGISCRIETGKSHILAGLHPAAGGDGSLVCSGDMLLESLVACAGVTLNAVATNLGFELMDSYIYGEGDMDFRGTLGVDKTIPVGLTAVRLIFDIKDNIPQEQKDRLIALTEKYCVIFQTLKKPPTLNTELCVSN